MHSPDLCLVIHDSEDGCWIIKPTSNEDTWLYSHDQESAERIASCLNACRGIPTEELVAGIIEGAMSFSDSEDYLARWRKRHLVGEHDGRTITNDNGELGAK